MADFKNLKIAIDGPAGAGKSTVAKAVARELGILYVDTGAMYRAIAYQAIKAGIPFDDEERISKLAEQTDIVLEPGSQKVWCNGEDVSAQIRFPETSRVVPMVARYPRVRQRLVQLQRQEALRGGVVMDGRDIGTHVLPEAELKIFLTASPLERAKRRWLELKAKGEEVSLEQVASDMARRDHQDTQREVSPLQPAEDAFIIDTTNLSVDEIVQKIIALVQEVNS